MLFDLNNKFCRTGNRKKKWKGMLRNEYRISLHFYFWDFAYIFTFWFITDTSVVDEAGRNRRNHYCIYLKLHRGVIFCCTFLITKCKMGYI